MSRRHIWVGAAIFALFAALQLNDPDPLGWVIVYGMTALYSCLAAVGRLSRGPVIFWAVLMGIAAIIVFATYEDGDPSGASWMGLLGSELVREGVGLALVAGWSGYLGWLGPEATSGVAE